MTIGYVKTSAPALPLLTASEVIARNPNVMFLVPFEAPPGYAAVQEVMPPVFEPITQRLHQLAPSPVGGVWRQRWMVEILSTEQAVAAMVAARQSLLDRATARRYDVETGGLALPGGVRVDTARSDQDAITRVMANSEAAGIEVVDFKAASGWITMSIVQLRQVASAIALHVQACYAAERAHHEAIGKLNTPTAVRDYDLNAGWPGAQVPQPA